jgi:hypothetical protein
MSGFDGADDQFCSVAPAIREEGDLGARRIYSTAPQCNIT